VGPHGPNFFPKKKWGCDCSALPFKGWYLWEIVCNKRSSPILDMEKTIIVKWTWGKNVVVECKLVGEHMWCMDCEIILTCVHLSSCNKRQT
jgi:hypothetical protein